MNLPWMMTFRLPQTKINIEGKHELNGKSGNTINANKGFVAA